ncbi:aldehyde dehydrogenase family protein [Paenarthrobacter sp. DKR-5]|uniref:aldehyde dehydrogenase family protein n=1 Tax=Paenarthrobacter sp. DKR-5 TaxID=2835535 RepID=UPI001BDBFB6C|nr:aldehyde dehydrogenase family protein [Paenarthrobacter sp. DKR-5]MBT1003932.1 aldehyde dehydrogenase family protein [Paenarthrobacter sp. DKR-5]
MTTHVSHWINGHETASTDGYNDILSPVDGNVHVAVAKGTAQDVDRAAKAATDSAEDWRWMSAAERGRILRRIADALREQAESFLALESADTGKVRNTLMGEIENSAAYFEFYGTLVNLPIGSVLDVSPDQHVYTKREPYGVVGVITPWNLPLNQAARAVAPALAAGNTVVCKPSESTSQTTVALARLASECGLPAGVFNVVCGSGSVVGEEIVRHPSVRKVAFTGSVGVGRTISHLAADKLIPLTLELGGKSANIVFEDADLDFAASEAVRAFVSNAGQVCSSGTRLLVQRSIQKDFVQRVAALVAQRKPGVDYGPMITWKQFDTVKHYLDLAQSRGMRPLVGGTVSSDDELSSGAYVDATLFDNVAPDNPLAQEEIFGPVLVAVPFEDEAEAIRIANDSEFGLVGAVFSRDISRALRVAERIEAGQIGVNTWVTGAVETPFGGQKNSGYGREKGIEALNHYSQLKCIIVKL